MPSLFREIRAVGDLPAIGAGFEISTMDLKAAPPRTAHGYDYREMAKDVAAFASANGGVILVGACEAGGALSRYAPMSSSDIVSIKNAYEMAVRDRCAPVPVVDVIPVPMTDGSGSVLAVNVLPFPGAAVAVLWNNEGGVPTYAFPLRVTSQTKWLRAEQLPMLMIPDLRRKLILLDAIPAGERSSVALVGQRGDQARQSFTRDFRLKDVDPLGGSVTLAEGGGAGAELVLTIPIDAIDSVWKSRGRWLIAFRGRIDSGEYMPHW